MSRSSVLAWASGSVAAVGTLAAVIQAPAEATHLPVPLLAVDTDVTGNTATSFGTVEACNTIASVGGTLQIDIVVQGVPAQAVPDGPDGLAGLALDLVYEPSVLKITGLDTNYMLGANPGSNLFSFSDPVPDTDGDLRIDLADVSDSLDESGDGVIVRVTLEAVATGWSVLELHDLISGDAPDVLDGLGNGYAVSTIGHGAAAVGSSCDSPTLTPTPPPTPVSTPWVADQKKLFQGRWYRTPTNLTTSKTWWDLCDSGCPSRWHTEIGQALTDWNSRPDVVDFAVQPAEQPAPGQYYEVTIDVDDWIVDDYGNPIPGLLGYGPTFNANFQPCYVGPCTVRYGYAWLADNAHSGAFNTSSVRRTTVAHELGHLLSLAHESTNESIYPPPLYDCGTDNTGQIPHSVMAYDCIDPPGYCDPSCGKGEFWVQDFDVCGVNTAYPSSYGSAGCLTAASAPSYFNPLVPCRLLDTRDSTRIGANSVRLVQVTGRCGIPSGGPTAAILNVTVTQPTGSGYLTVYPNGVSRPLASNLNFGPGQTRPNAVTVKLGTGGQIKIFNGSSGSSHVIVDVAGWYGPAAPGWSLFNALPPFRILDTRNGAGTKLGPQATMEFEVTGQGGVPVGARAVVVNTTVTSATASSYLTLYNADAEIRPLASNLNFGANQTVANLVTVKLSPDGKIKIYNQGGSTHVILDVAGWYGLSGKFFRAVTPARGLDTRYGTGGKQGALGQGATLGLKVLTIGGLPASAPDVSAVVVNATVTGGVTTGSYLTLYPSGSARPNSSNLNFGSGQTIPNLAVVKVGGDGKILVYNALGSTHVILDIAGWFGP